MKAIDLNDKIINLNSGNRYIKTDLLRSSYLHYEDSLNVSAPTSVCIDNNLELGIVSSQVPEIAYAISSLLTCSLEDAKYTNGGYLPPAVVERVQLEIISPYGISTLWGTTGHRFILSKPSALGMREIIASILVARSKDTIFFFTGRYNNIKHSDLMKTVDLNQPVNSNPDQKWFDKFAHPPLEKFKPKNYHQIANFVVLKSHRGKGLSRLLINNIVKHYSNNHIIANNNSINHSQFLLCGKGFWQVGDPPWLPKMQALGFYLRGGAENFFLETDWTTLRPTLKDGKTISNIEYNSSFGLPEMYNNINLVNSEEHLTDRIPEVIKLAKNPRAKLQYYQAMYDFI